MKIEKTSENYILFTSEEHSFLEFFDIFEEKHKKFTKNNVIIKISDDFSVVEQDFFVLLGCAKQHQKNNTTFIVVFGGFDADKFPEYFNLVPTLQEAEDVLEMENIQRMLLG